MARKHAGEAHSHMWLIGILGMASGLALMIYVPSLKAVSSVMLLFAGFHLVGGIVTLASLYMMTGGRLFPFPTLRRSNAGTPRELDFGWAPSWVMGPLVAAVVCLAAAIAFEVAAPVWWPVSLALALLAASFFAGHLAAAATGRADHAALPLVDFLSSDQDVVLDGGCGAGRTSIAVARMLKHGKVVALDRFDSDYIKGGGRALLERNLKAAGLADRVQIEQGELTQLPFPDRSFDAAVSAHAIDHLGPNQEKGLAEMRRILRPGGRFLLVVWVPGWSMFSIANVFSFFLTRKSGWKRKASSVGFEIQQEGSFNGVWYLVLQRPRLPAREGKA